MQAVTPLREGQPEAEASSELAGARTSTAVLNGLSTADLLTLTDIQRPVAFRNLHLIVPSALVPASRRPRILPLAQRQIEPSVKIAGKQLDVETFMHANRTSGLLVLNNGEIALERYAMGRDANDRWASFSVTKSISSTLIAAALHDGAIKSLEDPVVDYLPELRETPYKDVSVKALMMMASGVDWNEDYTDPHNDLYSMITKTFIDHAKSRRKENEPGAIFRYNTGDTNLLSLIVERATGKPAQNYLHEKIWEPFGMADDAMWTLQEGHVTGGANLQMTLRDYGRFGLFFLEGGRVGERHIVPLNWTVDATRWMLPTTIDDVGYGFTWWINPDETFRAIGIFGQTIYLNPARQVLVVFNSAWPEADWEIGYARQAAFVEAVLAAL